MSVNPCNVALLKEKKPRVKQKHKTENVTLERIEWLVRRPVHGISVLIFEQTATLAQYKQPTCSGSQGTQSYSLEAEKTGN